MVRATGFLAPVCLSPFDDLKSCTRVATKKKKGGGEKEHLVLKYVTILTPVFKIRNLAGKTPEHQ